MCVLHILILVLVPVLVMTVSVIGMCLYNLSKGINQCRLCIKYMVDVLIELTKQVQSINVDTVDTVDIVDTVDEADYD